MSDVVIKKAVRPQKPLKMVLDGLAGSGKTYTALRLAFQMGKNICVIDTEHGRASLYAGEFVDGKTWEFATIELDCQSVGKYEEAMKIAVAHGADVVIIDSISPAWDSEYGILDVVDKNTKNGNSFGAWNAGSKEYKRFVNDLLSIPCHTICTMRSKSQYVVEQIDGKNVPKKIGLAPVQRDGIEYEFDFSIHMNAGEAEVIKSPGACFEIGYKKRFPGKEFAQKILDWLNLKPATPKISEPAPAAASEPAPTPAPAPTPDEVPEETPGIGPEYSPDEAFDQVIGLLKAGKITQNDLITWGMMEGLPPTLKGWKDLMTDEQKMAMIEAMTNCAKTGAFAEALPF